MTLWTTILSHTAMQPYFELEINYSYKLQQKYASVLAKVRAEKNMGEQELSHTVFRTVRQHIFCSNLYL